MRDEEVRAMFQVLGSAVGEAAAPPEPERIHRRARRHRLRTVSAGLAILVVLTAGAVSLAQLVSPRDRPVAPVGSTREATRPTLRVPTGTVHASRGYVLEEIGPTPRWDWAWSRSSSPLEVTKAVGKGGTGTSSFLVFPLIGRPADCVRRVELRVHVRGGEGQEARVAVYPSRLLSLADGRLPSPVAPALVDNRPRAQADMPPAPGWVTFDITELYTTWARGGPFPSQGHTVPAGTPLVVQVRAPSYDDPGYGGAADFTRTFDGAGAGPERPRLDWEAARDCPAGG